jgi:S-adenosylmethionine/arginine decarboxylase-like enzyme
MFGMGKKKERIRQLEELAADMHQIFGAMAFELGIFNTKTATLILDKLSAASNSLELPDTDLLPFDPMHVLMVDQRKSKHWGYHAVFDCRGGALEVITNGSMIQKFIRELVNKIDMKAYGEPVLEHFATHDPDKGGYTVMQMIETSSITGHFVDKTGDFYLDVFSCKPFDLEICQVYIDDFFKPKNISSRFIKRQA